MSEFEYKIIEQYGEISRDNTGRFTKEVNLISYRGAEPKIDIRKWDRAAGIMQRGITLDRAELETLKDILNTI